MTTGDTHGLFSAEIAHDAAIGSTVATLSYTDRKDAVRTISVGIAPELGSNMFRFRVGEHDLIYCDQQLLQRRDFTGNFVLWPLPNRVRERRYSYQGKTYSLETLKKEKRPQGNAVLIHGLVFDRAWQYCQPVVSQDSVSVTTYVDITPDTPFYAAYPFASRLSLTYTLTKNGVTITYHVENTGESSLPFGFALHPYFATLSGKSETRVSIPARAVMEADEDLLPTGRALDVATVMYAMFDLCQPVPVGNLKLDHVYTQLHPREHAVIDYRQQNMSLHISASDDFTHVVIFTPTTEPYVCLEHQTCATDAINLYNQGPERREMAHLLEVGAGESYSGSISYAIHYR